MKAALRMMWASARADCGFNPLWFPVGGVLFGMFTGTVIGGLGLLLR